MAVADIGELSSKTPIERTALLCLAEPTQEGSRIDTCVGRYLHGEAGRIALPQLDDADQLSPWSQNIAMHNCDGRSASVDD